MARTKPEDKPPISRPISPVDSKAAAINADVEILCPFFFFLFIKRIICHALFVDRIDRVQGYNCDYSNLEEIANSFSSLLLSLVEQALEIGKLCGEMCIRDRVWRVG